MPVIDTIADDTLQYGYQGPTSVYVGGFDWGLLFNWHAIPDTEMKRLKYKTHLPVRYKLQVASKPIVIIMDIIKNIHCSFCTV